MADIPPKIRVLVVDDHALLRDGLSVYFQTYDNFEVVGEAEDGQEAIEQCAQLQPDVVLMDIKMPAMDGITATQIICQQFPNVKVVILSSSDDAEQVKRAFDAGAAGYIVKNANVAHLVEALQKIAVE